MAHATVVDLPTFKQFSITLGAGAATETIPHGFRENDAPVAPRDVNLVPVLVKFYAGTPQVTLVNATNIVVDVGAGYLGDAGIVMLVNARIPHSTVR